MNHTFPIPCADPVCHQCAREMVVMLVTLDMNLEIQARSLVPPLPQLGNLLLWIVRLQCQVGCKENIRAPYLQHNIIIFIILCAPEDRLCGLVVRVPGYRYRGPGSILGATRFSDK
jgi:hypothetical protein